jgi:hypothetical protein
MPLQDPLNDSLLVVVLMMCARQPRQLPAFQNKIPTVGVLRRPVLITSFGDEAVQINSRKPSIFEVAVDIGGAKIYLR